MFEKAAPVMTYGGATATTVFSLDWNAIGVIVGILIGLIGLLLQWYYKQREAKVTELYKQREDARQQSLYDLQMILSADRPERLGDHKELPPEDPIVMTIERKPA